MSRVRVGVVLPDLRVGGLQAMAVRLAACLPREEFEPRVYTFDGLGPLQDDLEQEGIPAVHEPRPPGLALPFARRLAERFVADGIDVVHCHNITALHHGARAAWRARRLPVLYTEHDRDMPAPWKHRLLHRWIARYATQVVAVSQGLAEALVRYEGFPAGRTRALFNGVPDPREQYGGSRSEARRELGWDDAPTLLAVGSLTPVKNHAGLLRSLALVRERRPDVRLAVAGIGPLEDELKRQAAAGVLPAEAVTWLGERRDVPRLLAACDVFVLCSHSEGLPLSLIEAHGAGRASVCTDVGGNPEVMRAGRTGWLAVPGQDADLAEKLLESLSDQDRLAAAGRAARERFEQTFTHDRMVDAYVSLYRQLCPRVVA